MGVYIWGRVPDLTTAVADAKSLGMEYAVRAFIGPWSDTPPYADDLRPLAAKLGDPGYQALFREFQVIMLTAYDSFSYGMEYAGRESLRRLPPGSAMAQENTAKVDAPSLGVARHLARLPEEAAERYLGHVREEFAEFAYAISQTDRVFIVSNWEAENDVPEPALWPQLTQYLQARLEGIRAGRERARRAGYPAQVYTAFEFTILPGFQGRPSGLVEIGSRLRGLDYLSYSSWWSIGWDYDAAEMRSSFRAALQDIRGYAQQAGLPRQIIIGEFGEYWNLHPTAERLRAIVEASLEEGAAFLFNWVLYDQPGEKDDHGRDASHFGKFYLDGTLTPQGAAMRQWFLPPAERAAPGQPAAP
ncbi:MAG TPA: hypothetical protein VNN17_12775 [Terriglobia bacterium]|nr:hypothetical protein [Terriglobia bacterium]